MAQALEAIFQQLYLLNSRDTRVLKLLQGIVLSPHGFQLFPSLLLGKAKLKKNYLVHNYCRIQINLSVTRHGGYLMCRNMVAVTHHKGVLMKGLNCDNNQIWRFWPKIWLFASK